MLRADNIGGLSGVFLLLVPILLYLFQSTPVSAGTQHHVTGRTTAKPENAKGDHLVVVWTSGDPEVALDMVLMYTENAKKQGWWKDVTLVVWGPSQRLIVTNKQIRKTVERMKKLGVRVEACLACSNRLQVTDGLRSCGLDVKYMGIPLSDYIRNAHVVTF